MEEDEDVLKKELKEAFRIYDKVHKGTVHRIHMAGKLKRVNTFVM